MSVIILGHSFIRRLAPGPEMERVAGKRIQCLGFSGTTTERLEDNAVNSIKEIPEYMVLQVGGNDIKPNISPYQIYNDILDLVCRFKMLGVKKIAVCSLFSRLRPRAMTCEQYEKSKNALNYLLREELKDISFATFWEHCFDEYDRDLFAEDGVHLSKEAEKKFKHSLRHCIAELCM